MGQSKYVSVVIHHLRSGYSPKFTLTLNVDCNLLPSLSQHPDTFFYLELSASSQCRKSCWSFNIWAEYNIQLQEYCLWQNIIHHLHLNLVSLMSKYQHSIPSSVPQFIFATSINFSGFGAEIVIKSKFVLFLDGRGHFAHSWENNLPPLLSLEAWTGEGCAKLESVWGLVLEIPRDKKCQ